MGKDTFFNNNITAGRKKEGKYVSSNPAFFILGAQRSGTTLLRLLLNNHTDIAVPTESTQFMPFLNRKLLSNRPLSLSRKKTIITYLLQNSQFAKWKLDEEVFDTVVEQEMSLKELISYLYASFARKYEKRICGDKSLTFVRKLKVLSAAYPEAKFIHIVRDGRDTLLSLRKLHAPAVLSAPLFALEWRVKLSLIRRAIESVRDRSIEIRYEDLLRNPERELRKVCTLLGISFQNQMLQFWKKSDEFIAKHHSNLIFRPLDSSNIFKWKNDMSETESCKYSFIAGNMLENYNYDIPSAPITLRDKLKWTNELILSLPKRMFWSIRIAVVMRLASIFGLKVGPEYYDSKFKS